MKVLYCAIALTVVGCSSHSRDAVTTAPSPDLPDSPETAPAQQPFDSKSTTALVPQVSAPENIPGLVQLTNGDERARQLQRIIDREKRQDPFAPVPITLRESIPFPDRPVTVAPSNQAPFSTPSPRQTNVRRKTSAPRVAYYPYFPPLKPLAVGNKPSVAVPQRQAVTAQGRRVRPVITVPQRQTVAAQVKQNSPVIAVLPPLPGASLANAVEISGVVVVGKVTQVIVKAPNETSSRHVQTGQRLANGQILVKRVEIRDGVEPIIILEENGMEVAKTIG